MHALYGEGYTCVHGRKDSCTFDQGLFWLPRPKQFQVIHVQEICFFEVNQTIISSYYFSRLRTPELEVHVSMLQWWSLFYLKETGWGPPRESNVIRVQVLFSNFFGWCLSVVFQFKSIVSIDLL